MKIIVGLGNPGKEYSNSRHNAGFMFLDQLKSHKEISEAGDFHLEKKFEAEISEIRLNGQKLLLVRPQTFMNLSGIAVKKIVDFYRTDTKDLIVISDDLDLPVGMLRIRHEGSSGGQKGLQNIIDQLKTDLFTRVRIGILEKKEKVPAEEVNDYVLSSFGKRFQPIFNEAITLGVDYIVNYLKNDEPIPAHTLEITEHRT